MSGVATALASAAALGSAALAGVFGTSSGFVMRALGDLPPAAGAAAMQAVNVTALRPPLLTAIFGTGAICVAAVVAVLAGGGPLVPVAAGAAGYLVGAVMLTGVANVPLNEELRCATPGTPSGDAVWSRYLRVWTRWNTVRAALCLAAAVPFAVAAML